MITSTFQQKIRTLIELGSDPEELSFWVLMYEHLSKEEQEEICNNLEKEIKLLEELSMS